MSPQIEKAGDHLDGSFTVWKLIVVAAAITSLVLIIRAAGFSTLEASPKDRPAAPVRA